MKRNIIGIYRGGGASWQFMAEALAPYRAFGLTTRYISRDDIFNGHVLDPDRSDLAAFVLMGSSEGQRYRNDLGTDGMQRIRGFAESAMVLGVCAGGQLLMRHITWDSATTKRTTNNNIGAIEGCGYGPLPHLLESTATVDGWFRANATSVTLTTSGEKGSAVYWSGGYMVPAPGEQVETIATFDHATDLLGNPAIAVARKKIGDGWAVFSGGIHPEVSGDLLQSFPGVEQFDRDGGEHRLRMARQLHHDGVQAQLLDIILQPILPAGAATARRLG